MGIDSIQDILKVFQRIDKQYHARLGQGVELRAANRAVLGAAPKNNQCYPEAIEAEGR